MQDPIVQTKTCHHCQSSFAITQGDLDFYAKISPTFDGQKFQIPTPTLCPDCRQRRRLSFRNERNLYRRSCDASGKQIISIYSPDKPYKVYDQKIWRSDGWDPMSYGRAFDFSRSFTEQFGELMREVPRMGLNVVNNEASEYVSFAGFNKHCYLIYTADQNENCMYGSYALHNTTCLDFLHTNNSELCYQVAHCNHCYDCFWCVQCISCVNCRYCFDMIGCRDCFLSYRQKNVQYCFKNKVYQKEEYEQQVSNYMKNTLPIDRISFLCDLLKDYDIVGSSLINCTSCKGRYLTDCNDVIESENCTSCSHLKYCSFAYEMHNSMDWDFYGDNGERGYECVNTANNCYRNLVTANCWGSSTSLRYCDLCMYCADCFGCIGLRNKSYCIFNKQYTKDDYEKTVAKIINYMISTGEWGEFFHPSLSPFGYNETVAQEYYPVTPPSPSGDEVGTLRRGMSEGQGEVLGTLGYHRSTYEPPKPVADKVVQGKDLPESIDQVEDTILQSAIACEVTGKLFRIQPQELVFYRKHNIPLPRRHPDQRHLERLALRR